jgi:hypothetical protein
LPAIKNPVPWSCSSDSIGAPADAADAAQVGSAAAMNWLAVEKCGAVICVLASVRRNFFNVRPPCSKIDRESEYKNKSRFGNFQSRNDFSISIR